jgi:predicted Zn-dependent protease
MKYILMTAVALAAAAVLSGNVAASPPDVRPIDGDEQRLWLRAEEEQKVINESGFVYKDADLEAYLNEVAGKLQSPDAPAGRPFRILVLRDPQLNAFAYPNGVIYLHSGLLARMDNEAQLATLLGHEMAHCTNQHALKAFRKLKNERPASTFQVYEGDGSGNRTDLLSILGPGGALAGITAYTRELEAEADDAGLRLVVRAGYDPKEGAKLFDHLKDEIEIHHFNESFLLETHPKIEERIENCRRFLETHDGRAGSGIQTARVFLEKVHKLILENALLELKAGRFLMAEKGLEKYLSLRPEDARAYHFLGETFVQQKNQERAKTYFDRAIEIDPAYLDPHRAIGMIYYKSGERRRAKGYFETCLILSPTLPDRSYLEGYLAECKEEYKGK